MIQVTDPSQKFKLALFIVALILAIVWGLKVLEYLKVIALK